MASEEPAPTPPPAAPPVAPTTTAPPVACTAQAVVACIVGQVHFEGRLNISAVRVLAIISLAVYLI